MKLHMLVVYGSRIKGTETGRAPKVWVESGRETLYLIISNVLMCLSDH